MSLERKMYAATKRREYFLDVNLDTKAFTDQILINPIFSKSVESNKSILVSYDDIDIQDKGVEPRSDLARQCGRNLPGQYSRCCKRRNYISP